jgi:hypothetical protein
MESHEKHKYVAGMAFKLLLMFLTCMAGIGILVLFETISRTIN